ncbi:MAG: adenosylcobinamide-GDP ribazoletransferase [Fibrobacterota bacterium]
MTGPLVTAVRTLTLLPVPGKDTPVFTRAFWFFPVAGALLSAVAYGLCAGAAFLFPEQPWLSALLLATVLIWLTGALHLDGLADVADGFGGGRTRARILEIMKDPCQGTFGVAAIALDLMLKTGLYCALIMEAALLPILASLVLSRAFQPLFMAASPYARPEGGTGQGFCGDASSRPAALFSAAIVTAMLFYALPLPHALAFSLTAFTVMLAVTALCRRKLGGITGDCIGACSELIEIAVLLAGVILMNRLPGGQ